MRTQAWWGLVLVLFVACASPVAPTVARETTTFVAVESPVAGHRFSAVLAWDSTGWYDHFARDEAWFCEDAWWEVVIERGRLRLTVSSPRGFSAGQLGALAFTAPVRGRWQWVAVDGVLVAERERHERVVGKEGQ